MLQGWVVIAVALGYIGFLFLVASYGDRTRRSGRRSPLRVLIYPLSLAVYCTSWTFFGSVGLASQSGYDFLTIYIGPILVVGLCAPLLLRIVRLAKAQNITSIADFIAARYGKSQAVAATVALIAVIGVVPYVALQLKAVSTSLSTILSHLETVNHPMQPVFGDMALFVALAMAIFAMLFGTRQIDATEHQDGLMLAIATESMVKLVAFLAVGVFVTFWLFGGPVSLFARALQRPDTSAVLTNEPQWATVATMTLLSAFAIFLLPRQFHVSVVENHNEREIRLARWLFPVYLVLINIFVIPIAMAGLMSFPRGLVDGDMYVLALPLNAGSRIATVIAFVGGLSAATAMVIVECVALAIMVANDLIVPLVLKRRERLITEHRDVGALLLAVRRGAIFVIVLLAYAYYRSAADAQLAAIGLLAFAAVAQLAPAFFGGLIWRRATARGAIAGMVAGILVWAYTLLLPNFADVGMLGTGILDDGPFGIGLLRPQSLFGLHLPTLVNGMVWSLLLNVLAYVAFSLSREPASIERLQASVFVPPDLAPIAPGLRLWRPSVTVAELAATVARYLGDERTRTALARFAAANRTSLVPSAEADFQLLRHAEHLLASAIGTSSSRLVISLLLRKRAPSAKAAMKLLDDANAAIHHNREVLQTALDHVRQGIAVFDKEFGLICWNRQFGELLALPVSLTSVGVRLDEILRHTIAQGGGDAAEIEASVGDRLTRYLDGSEPLLERFAERGLVVEVRTNRMPDGGLVATLTDTTPSVAAAEALEQANESLERRVRERTEELTRLNDELGRAKREAEEANISKTRFLAAASHDILQPLNAARLYVTSMVEREDGGETARLAHNIDASLGAVEEIFGALLDISRLDSGVMKPEIVSFRIDEVLRQLEVEFAPLAQAKGLDLIFVPCSVAVKSDRRLLRRLLQNLVSNAIKYTPAGRVLVGCRRRGDKLQVSVHDTGLGIPKSKQRTVFAEFHRLDNGAKVARGLGLGLSIVERIARVLDHRIGVRSAVGRGSAFLVELPHSAAAPLPEAPTTSMRSDPGPLTGTVLLCIDNEPAILDGMEVLLRSWGCRVLKAPDLPGALAAIHASPQPPDGLLVDYHLDSGNGIEAVATLRREFDADLPAILITADRNPAVRDAARHQAIQVINKPVKPATLRALLAQLRVQRLTAAE